MQWYKVGIQVAKQVGLWFDLYIDCCVCARVCWEGIEQLVGRGRKPPNSVWAHHLVQTVLEWIIFGRSMQILRGLDGDMFATISWG